MNEMKTYTVTGANGYIGSNLVRSLLKDRYHVKAVIRANSYPEHLSDLDSKELEFVEYDGTYDSIVYAVDGTDGVFHLGALYSTKKDSDTYNNLVKSNLLFSTHLFEALENISPESPIVSTSTFSAYDETGAYSPQSFYAATKASVELLAQAFQIKATFLRLGDTYGPNDWRTKVHNLARDSRIANKKFEFRSPKNQKINLTHIDDVISSLKSLLEKSTHDSIPQFHAYDYFYKENEISLQELADLIFSDKSEYSIPDFGRIIKLPKQRSIAPGIAPTHNVKDFISKTIYGDEYE